MNDNCLSNVLSVCEKNAQKGYLLAKGQCRNLRYALDSAQNKIGEVLFDLNNSTSVVPDVANGLVKQLKSIQDSFDELSDETEKELQLLLENKAHFSISLFGQTMAGKSTLMEILTEGNGSSIGKGAQRTTRDVRKYFWNGLEIVDVPGIGAFEGQEDVEMAFQAARTADVILFLLTDNAPGAEEAEFFSQLLDIGKPVICVINVKSRINLKSGIERIQKSIGKSFNNERLDEIKRTFQNYATKVGQDWTSIPFVYSHLWAEYLARRTDDIKLKTVLSNSSNFSAVEEMLTHYVDQKGPFIRFKTYIDTCYNPTLRAMKALFEQSVENNDNKMLLMNKGEELSKSIQQFEIDIRRRKENLIQTTKSRLNAIVSPFAEDHFSDKKADKAWEREVIAFGIEEKIKEFLDSAESRCDADIEEYIREIKIELKLSSVLRKDKSLRMHRIIDGKRIWNWTTAIVSTGFSISAGIVLFIAEMASFATPLGWIATGTALIGMVGSLFIKSRERKEAEARMKLEHKLKKSIEKMCGRIDNVLEKNIKRLIQNKLNPLPKELYVLSKIIGKLASTQFDLAWSLNNLLLKQNAVLIKEAIDNSGQSFNFSFVRAARIPGFAIVLLTIPEEKPLVKDISTIEKFVGEKVICVEQMIARRTIIWNVLEHKLADTSIKINWNTNVAYLYTDQSDAEFDNRIILATQITDILVTKK